MAQWQKIEIQRENGETVDAQAPIIVSASRSTKRQLILDEVTHLVSGKRFIKLNYITIQWTRVLENNEGREF